MLRAECGGSRCTCDHTLCDVGWKTVSVRQPNGQYAEAAAKCPSCFVAPEPSTPSGRFVDARELGAEYVDHAAAAAGDK